MGRNRKQINTVFLSSVLGVYLLQYRFHLERQDGTAKLLCLLFFWLGNEKF